MSRANVISLILAISLIIGTNATASGSSPGNVPLPAQSTPDSGTAQSQAEMTMNVPLLVGIDGRAQVRDIQHSQRLPSDVNDLLWQSVRKWTKKAAIVNGKQQGGQFLMNVTLHAKPQADGKTSVYFTVASVGPLLQGHWTMHGDRIFGHCTQSSDMTAGNGGKEYWCSSKLTPASASSTPDVKPEPASGSI